MFLFFNLGNTIKYLAQMTYVFDKQVIRSICLFYGQFNIYNNVGMERCSQALTMLLQCSCKNNCSAQQSRQSNQINNQVDLRPLYQKFAQALQKQLKNQNDAFEGQIDQLNSQIFTLKNTIQRLELRNKKDNESEKELRREYNILVQKLKQMSQNSRQVPQIQIVEKVKEVRVEVIDKQLPVELARWKKKYEEATNNLYQTKSIRDRLGGQIQALKEQNQDLRNAVNRLKEEQELRIRNENKFSDTVQKLQAQIDFFKNQKEIIVETKHFFPDFNSQEKVRPEIKIETVYIQKPIQKVVLVEVEKRVKQFIQPERPLVNRIITCEPAKKSSCRCEEYQYLSERHSSQAQYLSDAVEKLEGNIREYKQEREKLVGIIEDKNRELNSYDTRFKLYGQTQVHRGPSSVNVVVTKTRGYDQQGPISQKNSRGQNTNTRKR